MEDWMETTCVTSCVRLHRTTHERSLLYPAQRRATLNLSLSSDDCIYLSNISNLSLGCKPKTNAGASRGLDLQQCCGQCKRRQAPNQPSLPAPFSRRCGVVNKQNTGRVPKKSPQHDTKKTPRHATPRHAKQNTLPVRWDTLEKQNCKTQYPP